MKKENRSFFLGYIPETVAGKPFSRLFFLLLLSVSFVTAQTTVTYTQQTANYYSTFTAGTAGAYNSGGNQVGMYANTTTPKHVVLWRKFRTDASGANTSDRAMQVGDQFIVRLSATRANGRMGFALLASPATGSYANRESSYALSVNLDGPAYLGAGNWGNWYIKYSGGATAAAGFGGQQTTYKNVTFTLTLTAPDRMNVTMTDGITTSNFYDVQLNTSNPITDYSIFLEDDNDGGATRDIFWGLGAVGTQHTLTNTGALAIGQSNNSFTISGAITNGLDANSTSVNALNNTLTKTGTGTVTLSGANVYAGNTNLNGGTLSIGAAAGLSSNSKLVFNGGNLSVGNVGAGAVINGNTLNFQANASIDLGASASTFNLNFANSSAEPWDLSRTITVYNWTPSAGKIINVAGAGLTAAQLARINFDNYGVGAKFVGNELRPAFLYVTHTPASHPLLQSSGNYDDPNTWINGDKPLLNDGTESIYVQPGFTLNFNPSAPTINVLRLEVGGVFNMGANENLVVFNGGDLRVAGSVTMAAATSVINIQANVNMITQSSTATFSPVGTINFLGNNTITSNSPNAFYLPNVNVSTANVNFGLNTYIQNGSTLALQAGGYVQTNAPYYQTGSTLKYNTGGTYARNTEWSATTGRGYPYNVQISNGTTLNVGAWSGAGTARQCAGSLTIDALSTFSMNEAGEQMTAAVTVLGNVNVNGTLKLSGTAGGDIKIGGNYTFSATGTVLNNGRAVFFNGLSGDQLITRTGGGIVDFDYLIIDKASGNVKMTTNTNGRIISTVNNDLTQRVLQLLNGDFDMNDGTFTLQGDNQNSMNVLVSNGTRKIFTSTGTGEFQITGSNAAGISKFNVISQSAGKLLFDNNVVVSTTVGVNFGAGAISTVNAILRIDQYGYVITNSPNYGTASTLIYNNGAGGYNRNMEWNTNTFGTLGTGYPNNVIVQNNTVVDLNSVTYPATFPLGCSGKMRIESGSSVITGAMANTLSVGDSLVIAGSLTLSANNAGDLFVGGSWFRTGTFTQNDRMVTFDSTNTASIKATGGQTFSRMTINKKTAGSIVTVDADVTITNELFLQRGDVTLNNDVIIVSDITRTARIGETTTPGNISLTYNTGKFVIQRYLSIATNAAARRWRILTAPVKSNNAQTINAAWQEGQTSVDRTAPVNNYPGFGTAITRSTTSADGYDQGSTNNPSIYNYNAAGNSWLPLTATNTGKITDNAGYMIFVRGDRSILVAGTNVPGTPTTLRVKGEINVGDVTTTLNASGFQMLGNPFASAVTFNNTDFNGVNPSTTAGRTFYLWDPKLGGSSNVGGWITCTSLGAGKYSVSANNSGYPTDNTFTGIIESGMAIMVPAAGGSFTFKEVCKLSTSSNTGLASRPFPGAVLNETELFTAALYSGADNNARLVEGVVHVGNNKFDNEVNEKDGPKLNSFYNGEKIAVIRNGVHLSTELRKRLNNRDTVFYQLVNLKKGEHKLQFAGNKINNRLIAILQDKYTGKRTRMNVNDTTDYSFVVNDDAASSAQDRFMVVFRSRVKYSSIDAKPAGSDITVEWAMDSELNIVAYDIERSADGAKTFTSTATLYSKESRFDPVQYNWIDVKLQPGTYHYRIKGIAENGEIVYSDVVKAGISTKAQGISIFPNPVTGGIINLQMGKLPAGIYTIRLVNKSGQVVNTKTIRHSNETVTEIIDFGSSKQAGTYTVEITGAGKKRISLTALLL